MEITQDMMSDQIKLMSFAQNLSTAVLSLDTHKRNGAIHQEGLTTNEWSALLTLKGVTSGKTLMNPLGTEECDIGYANVTHRASLGKLNSNIES